LGLEKRLTERFARKYNYLGMEISISQLKDEADRFLQIDGKPRTLREISSAVGHDIGPYSKVLGLLDGEGKIEPIDQRRVART